MSARYSGDPSTSSKDYVRWLLGDTECGPDGSLAKATDEEIQFAIDSTSTIKGAAALVARAVANRLSGATKKAVGRLSIDLSSEAERWTGLADSLEQGGASVIAGVYAGGTSRSDKAAVAADADRAPGYFRRGSQDNAAEADDP